jgi:hypothetical protein
MDPEAVARVLRDRLAATRAGSEPVYGDPMEAAIERVTGRPEHPQPCQRRDCRSCGYARAMLILLQHTAQAREVGPSRDALLQRGPDLRALAMAAEPLDRALRVFESKLGEHVSRWAVLHSKLAPLRERGHDHEAMCERPRRALERARALRAELEALGTALLRPVRPELRALGQKPPDTLFTDFVRELAFVGLARGEIADLLMDACGPKGGGRTYWMGRIARAQRRGLAASMKGQEIDRR